MTTSETGGPRTDFERGHDIPDSDLAPKPNRNAAIVPIVEPRPRTGNTSQMHRGHEKQSHKPRNILIGILAVGLASGGLYLFKVKPFMELSKRREQKSDILTDVSNMHLPEFVDSIVVKTGGQPTVRLGSSSNHMKHGAPCAWGFNYDNGRLFDGDIDANNEFTTNPSSKDGNEIGRWLLDNCATAEPVKKD